MRSQMWYTITCEYCSKTVKKHNRQRTCSRECWEKLKAQLHLNNLKIAICPFCQKEDLLRFKVKDIYVCSEGCLNGMWRRYYDNPHLWEKHKRAPARYLTRKKCAKCQTEFVPHNSNQKYCCRKCRDYYQYYVLGKRSGRLLKAQKERMLLNIKIKNCQLCGTHYKDLKAAYFFGRNAGGKHTVFNKDHIIPKSLGGSDDDSNLRDVCWFCNFARGNADKKYDSAIAAAGKAFWEEINKNPQS